MLEHPLRRRVFIGRRGGEFSRLTDDGEPAMLRKSPGYGLTGMIERASLLGGTCEAGPNADRGWTVTATLPRVAT